MKTRILSPWCWRCLVRWTGPSRPSPLPRLFSTTPLLDAPAPPRRGNKPKPKGSTKGVKTLRINKKKVVTTGKPPARGERREFRKRIILSNPNALEVRGIRHLDKETAVDDSVKGSMVALSDPLIGQLRELAIFKPTQRWRSFRRPAVLWTEQSVEMGKRLVALEGQGSQGVMRRVLVGERGVGKSVMLLQAMAMALSRGWVVISIPECELAYTRT